MKFSASQKHYKVVLTIHSQITTQIHYPESKIQNSKKKEFLNTALDPCFFFFFLISFILLLFTQKLVLSHFSKPRLVLCLLYLFQVARASKPQSRSVVGTRVRVRKSQSFKKVIQKLVIRVNVKRIEQEQWRVFSWRSWVSPAMKSIFWFIDTCKSPVLGIPHLYLAWSQTLQILTSRARWCHPQHCVPCWSRACVISRLKF